MTQPQVPRHPIDREARRRRVMRGRAITAALSVSGAVALTVAIATSDHSSAGATNTSSNESNVGTPQPTNAQPTNPLPRGDSQADPFYDDEDGRYSTDYGGGPSANSAPHTSSGAS